MSPTFALHVIPWFQVHLGSSHTLTSFTLVSAKDTPLCLHLNNSKTSWGQEALSPELPSQELPR